MNKIYKQGRRKEYSVCDKLKAEGYDIVQRTAGSHSPFDIVALNMNKKLIRFIQVKKGEVSETEMKKLMSKYGWISNEFIVKFEVWK